MAPVNNGRVIFNEVPTDFPVPGETTVYDDSDLIDLDTVPLNGGYLVKALYLSIDPYFRHNMRKGYSYSFVLGRPITGYGIARVLRSEKEGINVGDNLQVAELPFQNYTVLSASHPTRIIENKENLPLSLYIGVLGMPGKTAYYGLETVNPPRKGDTLFVSAACGPVGCTVAQLAKAQGLKVIASAGTDEKVNFLKSVGVNFAFNYHKEKVSDALSRHGPINIYWDNVGGETLDAAIAACSDRARIIACGAITGYNGGSSYALKNWMQFDEKRLTMSGFLVHELEAESGNPDAFYQDMIPLVVTGQLKWKEHVYNGLDQAGHAILAVQKGKNCGKAIVKLADA